MRKWAVLAAAAAAVYAGGHQAVTSGGLHVPAAVSVPAGSNEALANQMAASLYGWAGSQAACLDALWTEESGFSVTAANPSSGAYGIPQALPGGKMASAGADWRTNPATQVRWGLGYIRDRYGNPCNAWAFERSHVPNWY